MLLGPLGGVLGQLQPRAASRLAEAIAMGSCGLEAEG